ncbi:hypothetical protein [Microbacterium yannicii]|uniref:hypothetical protein n=1 Tax=Microbacterium yannicii TaxID=671622 RepID=UPI0002D3ADD0|nr:hypothetical protein [Microbacterium yannicii]
MIEQGVASEHTTRRRLTPAMRAVVLVVIVLAVAGIAVSLWLFAASSADRNTAAAPAPSASAPVTQGPVPGATPATGSEVQEPEPGGAAPGSGGLPPVSNPTPLVAPPLPESASADGSLVPGYPDEIAGPSPSSDVLSSSIAVDGGTMQVTLVARTTATAEEVNAAFREPWAELGLAETASAGDSSMTFADGFTSLSLAFSPVSGTGTVYMIYGVFRTG